MAKKKKPLSSKAVIRTERQRISSKKAKSNSAAGLKEASGRKSSAEKKVVSKSIRSRGTAASSHQVKKTKLSKPVKKTSARTKASRKAAARTLGRPKVTAEEKLFLLFRDDYHARQIFEFLRVETVGELEGFAPNEIVDRLSLPIRETVRRIRERLADKNRCLKGDVEFAVDYRKDHQE